nr:pectin acetylesterase 8-like [Ipomoea batatas]
MDRFWSELMAILLLWVLLASPGFTDQDMMVNPTLVPDKGALCLSGIPAAYYFAPGVDEGSENWLVFLQVMIRYCDGSSFTGNSQKKQNGTKLYFRGAKIYKSTINEMKMRGLKSAKKALLVGESAGGVATTIHCDRFRDLFSSSAHVKCLSDAGFFFPAKKHNLGHKNALISIFEGLITLHV